MKFPPRPRFSWLPLLALSVLACSGTRTLEPTWREDSPPDPVEITWRSRLGARTTRLFLRREGETVRMVRSGPRGKKEERTVPLDEAFQAFWSRILVERSQSEAQRGKGVVCRAPYRVRIVTEGRKEAWAGCRNDRNSRTIAKIERGAARFLASEGPGDADEEAPEKK